MQFLVLGSYSNEALGGFVTSPEDDREAAVGAMMEKLGAKMHSMQFLRGEYDFAIMGEADSFDDVAAVKMLVAASGAMKDLKIMEVVDMNGIAGKANAIAGAYRKPGS
jgi:uncharacterized protein with GYD domain